jgi:hypothetical protein
MDRNLQLDLYHVLFSLLITFATMHAHKSLKEHKFLLQCEVMQGTHLLKTVPLLQDNIFNRKLSVLVHANKLYLNMHKVVLNIDHMMQCHVPNMSNISD